MRCGVRRRGIELRPLRTRADLDFVLAALEREEIWRSFGFPGPGRERVGELFGGDTVFGAIVRAQEARVVGFWLGFPPNDAMPFWELAYAIVERRDRDAFSAIHAADAALFYLFEVRKVEAVGWRTQLDNRPAQAVLRRLGYPPGEVRTIDGRDHSVQRIDRPAWARRRARVESAGASGAFTILVD